MMKALSSDPFHGRSHGVLFNRLVYAVVLALGYFSWSIFNEWAVHAGHSLGDHTHCALSAATKFDWYALKPSDDIVWTPCYDGEQCARLNLPLNYSASYEDDPDTGKTTQIALRMIPARDQANYRGSILINPGGPGGSGTNAVERFGRNLSIIVGPQFDILGFDPRGIGATTPAATCFDTDAQGQIWGLQEQAALLVNSSAPESIAYWRSRSKLVSERCASSEDAHALSFVDSKSVATDMVRIVEKLGQEKLQYWGFSYGTILGQYFATLYPEKIGRLVLDGVADAANYRDAQWVSSLVDTDTVLESLYHFCHASGSTSKCALYTDSSSTAANIQARTERILSTLRESPIALPFAPNGPVLITHADIQSLLFSATYSPLRTFPIVANTLVALESRNTTALASLAQNFNAGFQCPACQGAGGQKLPTAAMSEASRAIQCADAGEIKFDMEEYLAYAAALTNVSQVAGELSARDFLDCTEWGVRAPGRYTGPFTSTSISAGSAANSSESAGHPPILLVSPRYDPVCPLSEARIVQANFPGTALLVQNSHGHCSVSAPSLCTARAIREYFMSGKVPEEGTVCEVDVLPFIGKVSSSLTSSQGTSLPHKEEDEELAKALESLTAMPMSMQG